MARRRFFVDWIRDGQAEIAGENAHHLTRVLRVQPGQTFEITDNEQAWVATIESVAKHAVRFVLVEILESELQPAPTVLYLALIKFDRFEWALEKATELGVTRVIPVETQRSESGLFEASKKRVERWRKIVREASEQSRRLRAPVVDNAVQFAKLPGASGDQMIWLDESPGSPSLLRLLDGQAGLPVSLFVGPEGGWVDAERAQLLERGWRPASLGPTVLRAETAVCAALAVLAATRIR